MINDICKIRWFAIFEESFFFFPFLVINLPVINLTDTFLLVHSFLPVAIYIRPSTRIKFPFLLIEYFSKIRKKIRCRTQTNLAKIVSNGENKGIPDTRASTAVYRVVRTPTRES